MKIVKFVQLYYKPGAPYRFAYHHVVIYLFRKFLLIIVIYVNYFEVLRSIPYIPSLSSVSILNQIYILTAVSKR